MKTNCRYNVVTGQGVSCCQRFYAIEAMEGFILGECRGLRRGFAHPCIYPNKQAESDRQLEIIKKEKKVLTEVDNGDNIDKLSKGKQTEQKKKPEADEKKLEKGIDKHEKVC